MEAGSLASVGVVKGTSSPQQKKLHLYCLLVLVVDHHKNVINGKFGSQIQLQRLLLHPFNICTNTYAQLRWHLSHGNISLKYVELHTTLYIYCLSAAVPLTRFYPSLQICFPSCIFNMDPPVFSMYWATHMVKVYNVKNIHGMKSWTNYKEM